jgi:hypothetical protein
MTNYLGLSKHVTAGSLEIVKQILEDANEELYDHGLLHLASKYGRLEIVKYFFQQKFFGLKFCTYDRYCCMEAATKSGHADVLKYLFESKHIDLSILGGLFEMAFSNEQIGIIECLLEHGFTPTDEHTFGYYNRAFRKSIENDKLQMVKFFIAIGCTYYTSGVISWPKYSFNIRDYTFSLETKRNQLRFLTENSTIKNDFEKGYSKRFLTTKIFLKNQMLKVVLRPRSMHVQLIFI